MEEGIYNLHSQSRTGHSAAECQNVGIVVKSGGLCAEAVTAQSCPDSFDFIGCNGNSYTGSADENAFFIDTVCHCVGHGMADFRIIYRCCAEAAEVFYLISFFFQIF